MPSTKPATLAIDTTLPKITQKSTTPTLHSETDIYSVAQVAYSKLVSEAALKDQNLRRLVGHANLYDKLLDEYNNSIDSDSDSDIDVEMEEFASKTFVTPAQVPVQKSSEGIESAKCETVILEHDTYVYQDQHQQPTGIRVIEETGDIGLCKVASHSDLHFPSVLGVPEVEVKELEVFDE